MAKTRPFSTNFTRGELSAYIAARPDLGPYFNGVKRMENMIVLPEGGATRRVGTVQVAEVAAIFQDTILMPFSRSQGLSYIIEVGHLYMRFYRDGQRIQTPGPELITNGTFDTDVTGWLDNDTGGAISRWTNKTTSPSLELIPEVLPNFTVNRAMRIQQLTVTPGEVYTFTLQVISGVPEIVIGAIAGGNEVFDASFTAGWHTFNFTPATPTVWLLVISGSITTSIVAYVDNISCSLATTVPYEIAAPYTVGAGLDNIHRQQSIDVLFLDHGSFDPRKLLNFADTNWQLALLNPDPPPSVEEDEDISAGTVTLTPGAVTGTGITFTLSASVALAADVGRQIIGTAGGVADITAQGGTTYTADIIEDFPSTAAIAAGLWKLRLSPQTTLDPDKKQPIGSLVSMTAGAAAFRDGIVGKYIKVYGGVIKVTQKTSDTAIKGTIVSVLSQSSNDNPSAAPAGSWRVESAAWSATRGFPKTLDFHQGRLVHAASPSQPTTVWGSATDNFSNYAAGSLAADAYEFTVRSGKANALTWLASVNELMMGEENNAAPIQPIHLGTGIRSAKGPGTDEPLGGSTIPYITTTKGQVFYIHSSRTEIRQLRYNLEQDGIISTNLNILGRHLFDPAEGGSRIKQAAIAYAEKPNSVIYILREDGQLIAMTIYDQEQVLAFSHIITDGEFLSVAVIPNGATDQVWVIVRRRIGTSGEAKLYVEYFADNAVPSGRRWTGATLDCAKIIALDAGNSTQTLSGLSHLEAKTVGVIYSPNGSTPKSGTWLGTFTVSSGTVNLGQSYDGPAYFEVGLVYTPILQPLRAALPQQMMEGLPRKWKKRFARFKDSVGCTLNGLEFQFPLTTTDEGPALFTGDLDLIEQGWSTNDEDVFSQSFPGPLTILGIFGTLEVSPSD